MKVFRFLLIISACTLFFHCKKTMLFIPIPDQLTPLTSINLSALEQKTWYLKDIIEDSIPGVSLEKAYNTILKDKEGEEVIVAIIDTSVDIDHEDLKENIWVNPKEIPDNDIDDDSNGYVDDIYGWNFIGNKSGENNLFVNYEFTRIIKKYESKFSGKVVSQKDSSLYKLFLKAKKVYAEKLKDAKEDSIYISNVTRWKGETKRYLSKYFRSKIFTIKDLDSLKEVYPHDSILQLNVVKMSNFMKYLPDESINTQTLQSNEQLSKLLNLKYNDRSIREDNPDDIEDIKYGNNRVDTDVISLYHGTLMAGLIGAIKDNDIGINGFSNNIKMMILPVASTGDEHDKDIALAIRYAVDNGAKIINMSFGKEFTLYEKWVFEAIKYAEKHDVIIVSSAGNSSLDLNISENYPNDNLNNGNEISNNFLKIGAITGEANENLPSLFSNYGNIDVDIFAPGSSIYTTSSSPEKYEMRMGGTSASCAITSGIAALIRSYYPSLTASDVKQIIMKSGVSYNIEVNVPTAKDKKGKLPFKDLSKSGKIVNAYNALIMADRMVN